MANKYCASFPCSNLAEPGSAFCKSHKPAGPKKVAEDFYLSKAWQRFRNWYISKYPICALCAAEGMTVPAAIVDHVRELKDGGAPFDESNAQSLCRACHNRKTGAEKRRRGARTYTY